MVSKDRMYIVYMHETPNSKKYVGITSKEKPNDRWLNGRGYNTNTYFNNAIKKYGWENIKHEILFCGLSEEDAQKKEVELIKKYKSNNRDYGFNLTSGGEKNKILSQESKKLISLSRMGNTYKLGKKVSEETKQRMKENHADFKGCKSSRYGIPHTDEARLKISQNRIYTTGVNNPNSKPVEQFTLNGEFIKDWVNLSEAISKFRNKPSDSIKACCSGRTSTAYGYKWKYKCCTA